MHEDPRGSLYLLNVLTCIGNSYDPETTYSSIDYNKRYSFGNQPIILKWNISRFAEALLPIIHENKEKSIQLAKSSIEKFDELWEEKYYSMMLKKIGFRNNIITVPQGVSDLQIERQANSDFKIQIDSKKKNICYAGTIGISNHIEDILKLAKSLEKNCDIHFHFFGKGDKADLIKNTDLSNISYWGVIDRNQVISTLSKFDYLIFANFVMQSL